MTEATGKTDWREHGVRIVKASELDFNTPQTPGMTRAAAINFARAGASELWAGTVNVQPNAKTGAHHHGHLESIIYVVKGRARMRWGERLEYVAEAEPGDSGYFPMSLTPGKYIYACFFPEGGKKNGAPHFKLGMEGSFSVS